MLNTNLRANKFWKSCESQSQVSKFESLSLSINLWEQNPDMKLSVSNHETSKQKSQSQSQYQVLRQEIKTFSLSLKVETSLWKVSVLVSTGKLWSRWPLQHSRAAHALRSDNPFCSAGYKASYIRCCRYEFVTSCLALKLLCLRPNLRSTDGYLFILPHFQAFKKYSTKHSK